MLENELRFWLVGINTLCFVFRSSKLKTSEFVDWVGNSFFFVLSSVGGCVFGVPGVEPNWISCNNVMSHL